MRRSAAVVCFSSSVTLTRLERRVTVCARCLHIELRLKIFHEARASTQRMTKPTSAARLRTSPSITASTAEINKTGATMQPQTRHSVIMKHYFTDGMLSLGYAQCCSKLSLYQPVLVLIAWYFLGWPGCHLGLF